MKLLYNISLTILWILALSIGGYILFSEDENIKFNVFSSIAILLSALIASTSLMKSINNTNEINKEAKQVREQENRILLAFIMRTIQQIATSHIDRLTTLIQSTTYTSITNTQADLSNLNVSLKDRINNLIDKEMLHVLFYDMSTELYESRVTKLIELRLTIINLLARIDDLEKSKTIQITDIQHVLTELGDISVKAIDIKDD